MFDDDDGEEPSTPVRLLVMVLVAAVVVFIYDTGGKFNDRRISSVVDARSCLLIPVPFDFNYYIIN